MELKQLLMKEAADQLAELNKTPFWMFKKRYLLNKRYREAMNALIHHF